MTETSGRTRSGDVGREAGTRRDDLPVAGLLGLVARAWSQLPPVVVERVVMSAAEQREIVERRRPTVRPVPDMVGLGPRRRPGAVRDDASGIAQRDAPT
ncbi:MAG TPA: hypothetical protein VIJ41_13100 [Candidatus Nanopelagicales bacterium]